MRIWIYCRLVGGGFHLMTFFGGAFTLIDSELGHNFDDLTDINTFQTFAFGQLGPRQFHIMDEWAKEVSSARMPYGEKDLKKYCWWVEKHDPAI